ncbi:UNVERIFIED_CONTAM: hypothetical protein Sradi_6674300, partial [Sesamum radiatum]
DEGGACDLLQRFEEASGLAINWQKSAAVFSKNDTAVSRKELGRVLGVLAVDKHEKYLGLPTVIGCSTGAVFDHIKIRNEFPSQAGRAVLLKAVVQGSHPRDEGCFLFCLKKA